MAQSFGKLTMNGYVSSRLATLAAGVLIAGTASAQMMGGGVISTTDYFPMVDGARYDYVYTGGPWASSTAVMHGGQTWAGQSGLYGMHYNYTCNVDASCQPDATDFYGMGPSGMYYYGGTGSNATGSQYWMMSLSNPEWLLSNPVRPGTMMSGGGYVNAQSWSAAVSGTGNMMGSSAYMSTYFAQDLETVDTPTGTFANALHVREQRGDGTVRDVWYAAGIGIVMMTDGTQTMRLAGYSIPGRGTTAAALPFIPFNGLWWNPDESGSGYNIQVQHGVAVMTMFSYTSSGDGVWYYAPGTLAASGSNVILSGSLDHFRSGQCVSCAYTAPMMAGSDGTYTITFTSPTSATMQLPGGRTTHIQPQGW